MRGNPGKGGREYSDVQGCAGMCAVIVDSEVQCCVVSQSKVEGAGGCQACPSVSLPSSQIWVCLAGIVAVQLVQ